MTPRAYLHGTGLKNGQTAFPEEPKEMARKLGLKEGAAQLYVNEKVDDGAGSYTSNWIKKGEPMPGRLDALRSRKQGKVVAEEISEATVHFITLYPNAPVNVNDRIEIEGRMWVLTSEELNTDSATLRFEAREVRT